MNTYKVTIIRTQEASIEVEAEHATGAVEVAIDTMRSMSDDDYLSLRWDNDTWAVGRVERETS